MATDKPEATAELLEQLCDALEEAISCADNYDECVRSPSTRELTEWRALIKRARERVTDDTRAGAPAPPR